MQAVIIIVAVILFLGALAGNIDLIILISGGSLPDKQGFLIFLAVVADIALVCLAISRISSYIKNQNQKSITQKKIRVKELLDKQVGEKQAIIYLVSDYEKRYRRISRLLQLVSATSDINDHSLNQIDSYFNDSFEKSLPDLISQLPEKEQKRFPNNYHEIQTYRNTLSNELSELYQKTRDIDVATTKEEFNNVIGKDFKSATSKIDFKKKSRITIVVLACVLVASILVGIGMFFSSSFTFNLAKQDFEKNNGVIDVLSNSELGELDIDHYNYTDVYENSKSKLLWYSLVLENNVISKYYTQTENSTEAKQLLSIMKSIDSELSSKSYTYHHMNGWNVTFEFDQFTIKDKNGHAYKYESYDDGFYYLKIDDEFVIYHLGGGY